MKRVHIFISKAGGTLVLLALLLLSCQQGETESSTRTLLVYMAADNDLSADAAENLKQIERGYRELGAHLLVFMDTKGETPRLLKIQEKGHTVLKTYEETNSASADCLRAVIEEVVNRYPSERYGLVLWSHGTSWLPGGSALRSFGEDDGRRLDLPDLAEALPVDFDYLLMDACLMGSVEVAYELRGRVPFLLASSTEILAEGFPYETILPELLREEPDLRKVAQCYYQYYNVQEEPYRSATVSLVDTRELETLAEELRMLVETVDSNFRMPDFKEVQRLDVYEEQYHFDLLDFVEKAFPNADRSRFTQQLEKAVLYKAATPRFIDWFDLECYCGLSCYLPFTSRKDLWTYYLTLQWAADSGAGGLLQHHFQK